MINGLLFVNGIMGVTEYFHKQGGLELFGVLAHQGSSGLEFGHGSGMRVPPWKPGIPGKKYFQNTKNLFSV